MRWSALLLVIAALWPQPMAAQQVLSGDAVLNAQEIAGRDLFNQHCIVCHVHFQITNGATTGPALSKNSLGGQADVMSELISNGTPNMPGFKYNFSPAQIDAIVAYVKTLPVPATAAAAPH